MASGRQRRVQRALSNGTLHMEEIVDGIHQYDTHVFQIDGDDLPYL